jgi:predicted chitinase
MIMLQKPTLEQVWVDAIKDFSDVETVLYTRIGDNIASEDRNAAFLAKAAIESAQKLKDGKDGISYLREKLAQGMITPLSGPYEAEIIKRLEVKTLDEALKKLNVPPLKDA